MFRLVHKIFGYQHCGNDWILSRTLLYRKILADQVAKITLPICQFTHRLLHLLCFCLVLELWFNFYVMKHTFFNNSAVMSCALLCRSVTKPPFLHINEWSILNLLPHAQLMGSRLVFYPNGILILISFQNCSLLRKYLSSFIGIVVNQLKASIS